MTFSVLMQGETTLLYAVSKDQNTFWDPQKMQLELSDSPSLAPTTLTPGFVARKHTEEAHLCSSLSAHYCSQYWQFRQNLVPSFPNHHKTSASPNLKLYHVLILNLPVLCSFKQAQIIHKTGMLGVRKEVAPDKTLSSSTSKTGRVYKERVETN